MAGYLTGADATSRLQSRFGVSATITDGDADLASDRLDVAWPWIGERYSDTQEREFPRSITLAGDTENEIPDRVLDAVALLAYSENQQQESAAIQSMSVSDMSVTYSKPVMPQTMRRAIVLLTPYMLKAGARV